MTLRTTRTYAVMEVSAAAFAEIRQKLIDAGYQQALHQDGEYALVLDMHGVVLANGDRASDPDLTPSLTEELRASLRSGRLFGCHDEPIDDAGMRVVRRILDRIERIGEDRRSARNACVDQVLDIIKTLDAQVLARYNRGESTICGYANTTALYAAVRALREDHDDDADPPHTGDDPIIDALSSLRDTLQTIPDDVTDASAIGDHVQSAIDDLTTIEVFALRSLGYPIAADLVENGDV